MRVLRPAHALLTGVLVAWLRASAPLPRSPGVTARLANLRGVIDPSASRTGLAVRFCHARPDEALTSFEEVGLRRKFHQSDFSWELSASGPGR